MNLGVFLKKLIPIKKNSSRLIKIELLAELLLLLDIEEKKIFSNCILNIEKKGMILKLGISKKNFQITSPPLENSTLSIKEFWEALVDISKISGKGAVSLKLIALEDLNKRLCLLGQEFLKSVVTYIADWGIREKALIEVLFPRSDTVAIKEAFQKNSSISDLLDLYHTGGIEAIQRISINYFSPFTFMLPRSITIEEDLEPYIGYTLERKYDGIRLQIHKFNNEIRSYSRNLQETTWYLRNFLNLLLNTEDNFIIDGELISINNEGVESFTAVSRLIGKKDLSNHSNEELKFIIFDVLRINDQQLHMETFEVRQRYISTLQIPFCLKSETIKVLKNTDSFKDLLSELSEDIEGYILKDPKASYSFKRTNSILKLKRILITLDLILLGGCYGSGLRSGILSKYLFGFRSSDNNIIEIARVSNGFTEEEYQELHLFLLENRIEKQPSNVFLRKINEETVLINPFESSWIAEIEGFSINQTSPSRYSIRFPVHRYRRYDKGVQDITTEEELESLKS